MTSNTATKEDSAAIAESLKGRSLKYEVIYRALKQEIEGGEFGEGDTLASEAQLCERFDVSRGPVRQALAELERQGWIRRQAGKGTVVRASHMRRDPLAGTTVKQLVAVINTSVLSPANFLAFELVEGLNRAAEGAGERYRLNFQFHRQGYSHDSLSLPPCHGLLIAPFTFDGIRSFQQLAERHMPHVPVVSLYNQVQLDHVAQFYVDHETGMFEATDFLIRYGHKRLVMLSEPAISPGPAVIKRETGYRKALESAGLPFTPQTIVKVGLEPVMRNTIIEHLLRRPDRPTGLVVAGGVITRAVIQAIREVGLRVPQDLSVVAFDDTPEAAMNDPQFTVVRVPLRRIAQLGMEWLVEAIEGNGSNRPAVSMPLKPELIVRQSCGPVPSNGNEIKVG